MEPIDVTAEAVLAAENSLLRQENDTLRRTLAQHVAALQVLQAQPEAVADAAAA